MCGKMVIMENLLRRKGQMVLIFCTWTGLAGNSGEVILDHIIPSQINFRLSCSYPEQDREEKVGNKTEKKMCLIKHYLCRNIFIRSLEFIIF